MAKEINFDPRLTYVLLLLCIIHIFFVSLTGKYLHTEFIHSVSITFIFIFTHLSISKKIDRKFFLPIIAILIFWISEFLNLPILLSIASFTTFVYFFYVIIKLITKVAASNHVGMLEFTESIVVYLLYGIAASLIFNSIFIHNNSSFNIPENTLPNISDFTYFSFVTLSTLGYGDITPLSPVARSTSMFFSVSGQLYMAMIVAVLVGKHLSSKNS